MTTVLNRMNKQNTCNVLKLPKYTCVSFPTPTPKVKWLSCEADHSSHLVPMLRMSVAIPPSPPPVPSWLVHRDNFT